jgi:hypothetical protein
MKGGGDGGMAETGHRAAHRAPRRATGPRRERPAPKRDHNDEFIRGVINTFADIALLLFCFNVFYDGMPVSSSSRVLLSFGFH